MTQTIQIRSGNTVAVTVIGDLFERAFSEPYGTAAVMDLMKSSATWSLTGFNKQSDIDLPVGFVIGMTVADTAEIYSIGIPEEHRGQGFAKALLARALNDCAANGVDTVHLEVAADNDSAIGLYRHVGFQPNGRRKNYYRRGDMKIDAIMMARKL